MKKILCASVLAFTLLVLAVGCEKQYEGYQRDTAKVRQKEAQLNLEALFTAQTGFYAATRRYGTTFEEIGFNVNSDNQVYSYYMGNDVLKGVLGPDEFPDSLPPPEVTENSFTAYAIANLDTDPTLDIWRVDQNKVVRHLRDDR